MPGCPESFQSFEQREPRKQEGRGQAAGDQHQRVNQFRDGDVFAIPAGVAHWVYNNGDKPVVTFAVLDTSNTANQLDENRRASKHFTFLPSINATSSRVFSQTDD